MLVRLRIQGTEGRPVVIDIEAPSETEAIRLAAGRGARVLAVDSDASAAARVPTAGAFPLLLFNQELLALLEAGLNLNEALTTLEAKERRVATKTVLAGILSALREGKSFSVAIGAFPMHFPDVYVATVRAAERTGDLSMALSRYIGYRLQFDAMRKKLVAAMIYPLMLLAVGSLVVLFLVGYVVPRFSVAYQSAGRELPWASELLLAMGRTLHAHWIAFALIALAAIAGLYAVFRQEAWRLRVLDGLLRLPWLADRAAEFRLARLYGALSLLLTAGVPLVRAMSMSEGLLGPGQQARLALARREVEEGGSFSGALVAHGLAGPVAESLVKVGERSGRLAEMMERAARFHDDDFARWLDWASRLLEPILMMVIGLVVGAVVVLMYFPIFELAGSLR